MSAASSAVCRPPVCWWMFPCQITSTSVSTPAHYNGSQTVPGAVCGQSGREQVVRSEGHWREGYCVSHPAVSSDHTLSRPGSASVCVCLCACMHAFTLFGRCAPCCQFIESVDNLLRHYTCNSTHPAWIPVCCHGCTLHSVSCGMSLFWKSCRPLLCKFTQAQGSVHIKWTSVHS